MEKIGAFALIEFLQALLCPCSKQNIHCQSSNSILQSNQIQFVARLTINVILKQLRPAIGTDDENREEEEVNIKNTQQIATIQTGN